MSRALPIVPASVVVALLVGCASESEGYTDPGDDTNSASTAGLTASPSSPSTGETVSHRTPLHCGFA